MSFFDEAELEADPIASEPTLEEATVVIKKKYKGQRKEKLDNFPHKKVVFKLDSGELSCPQCSTDLKSVGEEFVRSEVEYIPAQLNVIDYYRETYECRSCKNTDEPYMEKSPMPSPVRPHSFASPSSVANVMYQKFVNAMPLYRQEKDWSNLGLNLTRQTMSNWILIASRDWLMPIRIFEYHPTRNGDHAKNFLKGFNGYLVDALPSDISRPEATLPTQAIEYC